MTKNIEIVQYFKIIPPSCFIFLFCLYLYLPSTYLAFIVLLLQQVYFFNSQQYFVLHILFISMKCLSFSYFATVFALFTTLNLVACLKINFLGYSPSGHEYFNFGFYIIHVLISLMNPRRKKILCSIYNPLLTQFIKLFLTFLLKYYFKAYKI